MAEQSPSSPRPSLHPWDGRGDFAASTPHTPHPVHPQQHSPRPYTPLRQDRPNPPITQVRHRRHPTLRPHRHDPPHSQATTHHPRHTSRHPPHSRHTGRTTARESQDMGTQPDARQWNTHYCIYRERKRKGGRENRLAASRGHHPCPHQASGTNRKWGGVSLQSTDATFFIKTSAQPPMRHPTNGR